RPLMQDLTLRVIAGVVLGRDDDPRARELLRRLTALLEFAGSWTGSMLLTFLPRTGDVPFTPWRALLRHKQGIDELLLAETRERRARGAASTEDVLGALLASSEEG